MNNVIMMGRLAADVTQRQTSSGTTMASFRIAVPRAFKAEGQPDADFFNVTYFGKTAETIIKNFHKGDRILVTGSMQNSNYKDRNGNDVYAVTLMGERFDFVETRRDQAGQQPQQPQNNYQNNNRQQTYNQPQQNYQQAYNQQPQNNYQQGYAQQPQPQQSYQQQTMFQQNAPQPAPINSAPGFMNIPEGMEDEELPFV